MSSLRRVWVIGFSIGAVTHTADLIRGGLDVYATYAPWWLQVFFVSLTAIDPLVALLVAVRRPVGVWLGLAVVLVDVPANWVLSWPVDPWWRLVPLTAFGLVVLVGARNLARHLSPVQVTSGRSPG
ncbi:hypothetical protein [Actinosynnema sp. NPDC020468]|uniref:hypothetical protein n=1 Tax=Actinosynnema sp. NPDC020468 TaxID=3154488 RepID=UPI00340CC8ED